MNEGLIIDTKPINQLKRMEKKAIILDALAKQGFNDSQAAKLMGIAASYPAALKDKRDKGLLAPLANIARKSVKSLAKGQLVGQMDSIKGSDVLGACNAILDRVAPKVNINENKSLSIHMTLTDEERTRIRQSLGRVKQINQDESPL